jgi:hypothetical protein
MGVNGCVFGKNGPRRLPENYPASREPGRADRPVTENICRTLSGELPKLQIPHGEFKKRRQCLRQLKGVKFPRRCFGNSVSKIWPERLRCHGQPMCACQGLVLFADKGYALARYNCVHKDSQLIPHLPKGKSHGSNQNWYSGISRWHR